MAIGDHISGMLNLGALAVVFSAAYVGWDKVDMTKASFEQLEADTAERLKKIRCEVDPHLIRFGGLTSEGGLVSWTELYFFPMRTKLKVYALCKIADIKVKKNWRNPFYFVLSQYYVPLFFYYRRRVDIVCARALTVLSLATFLAMTAATIWNINLIDNNQAAILLYYFLSTILVWIIVTNIFAYRISQLQELSHSLTAAIIRDLQVISGRMMRFLPKKTKPDEITP